MAVDAKVMRVFIASPSDTTDERRRVRDALNRWNDLHLDSLKVVLVPVGWETHSAPDLSAPAQQIINRQLRPDECDILVGIFSTRVGSATSKALSGTVEEINTALAAGRRTMLYFSRRRLRPDELDLEQVAKVQQLKKTYAGRGLFAEFRSLSELGDRIVRDMTQVVRELLGVESAGAALATNTPQPPAAVTDTEATECEDRVQAQDDQASTKTLRAAMNGLRRALRKLPPVAELAVSQHVTGYGLPVDKSWLEDVYYAKGDGFIRDVRVDGDYVTFTVDERSQLVRDAVEAAHTVDLELKRAPPKYHRKYEEKAGARASLEVDQFWWDHDLLRDESTDLVYTKKEARSAPKNPVGP